MTLERSSQPTVLVIFGAMGDLSRKKLISSIFDLYVKGYMPESCTILGVSRDDANDESFREFIREVIKEKHHGHSEEQLQMFLKRTFYFRGLFEEKETHEGISRKLLEYDEQFGECSNKLFYLAVPPVLYKTIFKELAQSGLSIPCSDAKGWTRVLVEKPFGNDLQTAQELDRMLARLFKEEQIFRIDHYLAKETVQNLLTFRFSNGLFEPIWNREHVERVEITMHEDFGVGSRGNFYEGVGAIRDMGQNHMLQMLALIAMDHPRSFNADSIRKNRNAIFRTLHKLSRKEIEEKTIRGQYVGYREEDQIGAASTTETYFRLEAYIDNKRWKGVPFILESGKKMKETKTEITVHFKSLEGCLCPPENHEPHGNSITFRIQPNEGVDIGFWIKRPGFTMELQEKKLEFLYEDSEDMKILPGPYERVLYDCIRGDQTLFTSTDEVESAWRFITPIVEKWGDTKLHIYEPGSNHIINS